MQAPKIPWYKFDSHHAVHQITKAPTWQQKQKAIDAYMDKKLHTEYNTDQNIACLQQKLQELCRHLSSSDADQVRARSSYYLQHVAALVNQKALMAEAGDTTAAEVAFQADREEDLHSSIDLVIQYIRTALHSAQGPNARAGAIGQCRSSIEIALAFPKPPEWSYQLNSFSQQEFCGAVAQAPGGSAKRAASQLNALQLQNAAQLHQVNKVANQYFYDKIETSWNVGANQGHIQDKLQSLLPLLQNSSVMQQVSTQAAACQQTMAIQQSKKLEEEQAAARNNREREKMALHTMEHDFDIIRDDIDSK